MKHVNNHLQQNNILKAQVKELKRELKKKNLLSYLQRRNMTPNNKDRNKTKMIIKNIHQV